MRRLLLTFGMWSLAAGAAALGLVRVDDTGASVFLGVAYHFAVDDDGTLYALWSTGAPAHSAAGIAWRLAQ